MAFLCCVNERIHLNSEGIEERSSVFIGRARGAGRNRFDDKLLPALQKAFKKADSLGPFL